MGRIRIEDGLVALEMPGLLGLASRSKQVEKRDGEIQVLDVRIRWPWMRTVIHLGDTAHASVGPFAARRIVHELEGSGFSVKRRSVWLLARSGSSPGDLERIR